MAVRQSEVEDCEEITNLTDENDVTLELTALWIELGVTVSFDTDGAEGAMKDKRFAKGDKCILPSCEIERAGYEFAGWIYNGKTYLPNEEIEGLSETARITVRAKWEAGSYTIKFVNPYGENTMANLHVKFGESVRLPKSVYKSQSGKPMLYWKYMNLIFEDEATVTNIAGEIGDVIELTACWNHVNNTVNFSAEGGYGGQEYISFSTDNPPEAERFGWVKDGYSWVGWQIGDKIYREGEKFDGLSYSESSYTATAVWEQLIYRIHYHCGLNSPFDSCSHDIVTDEFVYEDSYKIRIPSEFVHLGYESKEVVLSGKGIRFSEWDIFTRYSETEIDVYLDWKPIECKTVIEIEDDYGSHAFSNVYAWEYGTDIEYEICDLVHDRTISIKTGYLYSGCTVYLGGVEYSGPLTTITTDKTEILRIVVKQNPINYKLELWHGTETETVDLTYDVEYSLPQAKPYEGVYLCRVENKRYRIFLGRKSNQSYRQKRLYRRSPSRLESYHIQSRIRRKRRNRNNGFL